MDMQTNLNIVWNLRDADTTEEGAKWYSEAFDYCFNLSILTNISVETIVEVLGLLSVGSDWERNKMMVVQMLATNDCNHMYGRQTESARQILCGQPWSEVKGHGPKVDAFVAAVLGDQNSIVVDRHAFSALIGQKATEKDKRVLRNQYDCYAEEYRKFTDSLKKRYIGNNTGGRGEDPYGNYSPRQVQAIVWVTWKKLVATRTVR